MYLSQTLLLILPVIGYTQAAAFRRGGGYEHHPEPEPVHEPTPCHPKTVYETKYVYKTLYHPTTIYDTKTVTEHKKVYHTVTEPVYHTTTEYKHKTITAPPPPEKTVTKTVTEHKYITKEGEKVYVTKPCHPVTKHVTVTHKPTPKCTKTAKPRTWPQPIDCHDGHDSWGDKCDCDAPVPTTYAHWDYNDKHCIMTWDDKWEPKTTHKASPPEETGKGHDGKGDYGKSHDGKGDSGKGHNEPAASKETHH